MMTFRPLKELTTVKYLIVLFLLFSTQPAFSQRKKKQQGKPIDYWGMVELKEGTWVDIGEVTVGEWHEYVYYNDPLLYLAANNVDEQTWAEYIISPDLLPDSTLAADYYSFFAKTNNLSLSGTNMQVKIPMPVEPITEDNPKGYFSIFYEFSNSPIMGITYEQALAFCKWRTARDSIFSAALEEDSWYRYRLPTPEEYDAFSLEADSVRNTNRNKEPGAGYNYREARYKFKPKKRNRFASLYTGMGERPISACSFFQDDKGLCDTTGNVSEMTTVKGLAKGSNFTQYARESFPAMEIRYSKAEKWLGFRCIAEKVWR